MTAALTPDLALAYVRELSADVLAGVVLDARGALLAGSEQLAAAACDLLEAAGDASEIEVLTREGSVFGVRTRDHAIVVACGRHALPAVVRFDLRTVLGELENGPRREAA